MVRKDLPFRARNIGSKTVRKMLSLSHFQFKEKILYLSKLFNTSVHLCEEHWTFKACGGCGRIDYNLGSKKVYDCNHCPFTLDRDYNGSRNIHMEQINQI